MNIRKAMQFILGLGLFVAVSTMILSLIVVVSLSGELRSELARIAELRTRPVALSTEVFDLRGDKIGEFADEQRYYIRLSDLPAHVPQAFLSAEDKDFYHHPGIDPVAILRSALANLRSGAIRQGASTITQQLARLYFLDQSKRWSRKLKEVVLAVAIEQHLAKDEILELYLNKIFLGNHSYGLEAAARNYFRKSAKELSVGEAALLAGLPKAPTRYAPNRFPKRASARQRVVLQRMAEDGYISRSDAKAWAKQLISVANRPEDYSERAPYFMAAVRQEIARKFEHNSLPHDGLRIYTTLDGQLQRAAATALRRQLAKVRRQAIYNVGHKGRIDGAIVSIDPQTGAVLAMQGGGHFASSQFNRALDTRRRLGRLFMPVYVSLALERGHTLASLIGSDPMAKATAVNAGAVPFSAPNLFTTVVQGLTLDGARVFTSLGAGSVLEHAKRLGLSLGRDDLMLGLGWGEATPMEMSLAYAAFFNGGRLAVPYFIDRIETRDGRQLYKSRRIAGHSAMTPQTAYIMHQVLQAAVNQGHAKDAAGVSRTAAGISAATDDLHNAWFAGGMPNLVTTTWLGAETGRARLAPDEEACADTAEEVWAQYMRAAPNSYLQKAAPLPTPNGVSFAKAAGQSMPFLSGTEPPGQLGRLKF